MEIKLQSFKEAKTAKKEASELMQQALSNVSELQSQLSQLLGTNIELSSSRDNGNYVYLESQDLSRELPRFLHLLFENITIEVMLQDTSDSGYIWGTVDYQYRHPSGSNGYNFAHVWFQDGKWIIKEGH